MAFWETEEFWDDVRERAGRLEGMPFCERCGFTIESPWHTWLNDRWRCVSEVDVLDSWEDDDDD